ncbi:hypothetical protein CEXT_768501 [Caerostris extrusa]|uniref:Uncharacterized protein n=1 Tax=Caerostris extrusa TaxID=172846 RepID=A0AAV4XQB3_CAEEX|nr:hypothetical protein CEXT_768501 [Caerostris extrusa]
MIVDTPGTSLDSVTGGKGSEKKKDRIIFSWPGPLKRKGDMPCNLNRGRQWEKSGDSRFQRMLPIALERNEGQGCSGRICWWKCV